MTEKNLYFSSDRTVVVSTLTIDIEQLQSVEAKLTLSGEVRSEGRSWNDVFEVTINHDEAVQIRPHIRKFREFSFQQTEVNNLFGLSSRKVVLSIPEKFEAQLNYDDDSGSFVLSGGQFSITKHFQTLVVGLDVSNFRKAIHSLFEAVEFAQPPK